MAGRALSAARGFKGRPLEILRRFDLALRTCSQLCPLQFSRPALPASHARGRQGGRGAFALHRRWEGRGGCLCRGPGGIQRPSRIPQGSRQQERHLWAILASTAIVITISNYAELYAFGAYYRHQRGVLFLFSTCRLACCLHFNSRCCKIIRAAADNTGGDLLPHAVCHGHSTFPAPPLRTGVFDG